MINFVLIESKKYRKKLYKNKNSEEKPVLPSP